MKGLYLMQDTSKFRHERESVGGSSVSSNKGVGTFKEKGARGRKALSDLIDRNPNKEADSSIADTVRTASEVTDENINVVSPLFSSFSTLRALLLDLVADFFFFY
ncbi:hypothetical protein ACLOJK_001174 [Asimina triloba]